MIYFESKPLYRSLRGPVPQGEHLVPIGEAEVARAGADLTIVAYGAQVPQALSAADTLAAEGVEAEVVDLRTLKPLDFDTVAESVTRTSRVMVVHSANRNVGVGAEVAARVAEECFDWLDAPVTRLGGLDTPIPFSPPLEDAYRPDAAKIAAAARKLLTY